MTIYEFADVVEADIIIKRYHNRDNDWIAEFSHCEIKDVGVLISSYGRGESPYNALGDYVKQILGKTIVFNAYQENRKEYRVPKELSI